MFAVMEDSIFTTVTGRSWLERQILPVWMPSQRWFAGKARGPKAFRIVRQAALGSSWLLGVEVSYAEGPQETYLVPLAIGDVAEHEIARMEDGRSLFDATRDPEFRATLFRLMSASVSRSGLVGEAGTFLKEAFPAGTVPESAVLTAEQSNSSLIYGDRLFVKLYRRLVPGLNPDGEVIRFLSERSKFRQVPAYGGSVEWDGCPVALAASVIPNSGDAWAWACRNAEAQFRGQPAQDMEAGALKLGQRTGELHVALVGDPGGEFAPEPWTRADSQELASGLWKSASDVRLTLSNSGESLPPACWPLVAELTESLPAWRKFTSEIEALLACGLKIRTHGDYHLGQVLVSGDDFVIIDFEGEPARTLEERRARRSPLRDVAGMLRSFHYAAHFAARKCAGTLAPPESVVEDKAGQWQAAFLKGWLAAVKGSVIDPAHSPARRLLHALLVEKAFYEIHYELNNRPDWVEIPLRGLVAALHQIEDTGTGW